MPVVYSAANPVDAHLCRQFLEEQGIDARVEGEILWQARGDLPPNESTNPTVSVSSTQFEQARELVEQFEQEHLQSQSRSSWTCSHCHEENPGSFEVCWNCNTASDSSPVETPM